MKKIEAWKTSDGLMFEIHTFAEKHQAELDTLEVFRDIWYRGMFDTGAEDIIDFLKENKGTILQYYDKG